MASNYTVCYHAPHSECSKVVNRNDTSPYGFWGRCRGAAAQGVRRGGAQGVFGERLSGHHHVVDRERGRWVEDDPVDLFPVQGGPVRGGRRSEERLEAQEWCQQV